jgi:cholesterol transport system auxiliary component
MSGLVLTLAAACVVVLLPACALLTKSAPVEPRYFSAEMVATKPADRTSPNTLELRLGRVAAGDYLKDRMVRRDSTHEVVYYDERLWAEKPETYVRRALAEAIFNERGVRRVLTGAATTLDVEVVAFEEITKPAHVGRVELAYTLYDDRLVRLSRSVSVDRPISEAKGDAAADAAVEAMASAMSVAVESVAIAATDELRTEAASQTAPLP